MGYNKNPRIQFNCHHCSKPASDSPSHYAKKSKHFCSQTCYTEYKKTIPPELHPRWHGGVSNTEAHRRWKAKNPERMAHLKAERYAREKKAEGSHSFPAWNSLVIGEGYRCVGCQEIKPLTKDHMIPLSKGGSDYIWNIQPLCRNCNSKKWAKLNIYENKELINNHE